MQSIVRNEEDLIQETREPIFPDVAETAANGWTGRRLRTREVDGWRLPAPAPAAATVGPITPVSTLGWESTYFVT